MDGPSKLESSSLTLVEVRGSSRRRGVLLSSYRRRKTTINVATMVRKIAIVVTQVTQPLPLNHSRTGDGAEDSVILPLFPNQYHADLHFDKPRVSRKNQ